MGRGATCFLLLAVAYQCRVTHQAAKKKLGKCSSLFKVGSDGLTTGGLMAADSDDGELDTKVEANEDVDMDLCKAEILQAAKEAAQRDLTPTDGTKFGHGRYAPEYAALCGVYNLYDAFLKTPQPESPQRWEDVISRLEYLAISLAPEDGKWCQHKVDPTTKVITSNTSILPLTTKFENYTVEDCDIKINEIDKAIRKNQEQLTTNKEKVTKLSAVGSTGLILKEDVRKGDARNRAYQKVLKLLTKANNDVKGDYDEQQRKADSKIWTETIKESLKGMFDEDYAKSIGREDTDQAASPKCTAADDAAKEQGCPARIATTRAKLCSPGDVDDGENAGTNGKNHLTRNDKFRAGHNILVDMACLCIPYDGTCTACTGTQPIPAWAQGSSGTGSYVEAPSSGKDAGGIKKQIQMLMDGCKAQNNYGSVTSKVIEKALENFDAMLGRWDSQNNDEKYVLADPTKKAQISNPATESTKEGDRFLLGKSKKLRACDGTKFQHCVYYAQGEAASKKELVPQWKVKAGKAREALDLFERALKRTSEIKHKIDILTEAAIQAREDALLPPPQVIPVSLFPAAPASTAAPQVSEEDKKKYTEAVEKCRKLDASEEECKKDETGCKWEGEKKCIPQMADPTTAAAGESRKPGNAHLGKPLCGVVFSVFL